MIELMVQVMQENDAPLEQYERLGLPVDGVVTGKHLLLATQAELVQKSLQPPMNSTEIKGSPNP